MKNRMQVWALVILVSLSGSIGCTSRSEKMRVRMGSLGDTWLHTVVRKNIAATGGVERWARLDRIEGEALATLFDADGGRSLVAQQHVIAAEGSLPMRMISQAPKGSWIEELAENGDCRVFLAEAGQTMPITDVGTIRGAGLKLLLLRQAMLAGVGLLDQDCQLRYLGQERKAGQQMHMVEMTGQIPGVGDAGAVMVLWFDNETFLLERLWLRYRNVPAGAEDSFGYLAANISAYKKTPDGLILPTKIELLRSDEHQQLGEKRFVVVAYEQQRVVLEEEN